MPGPHESVWIIDGNNLIHRDPQLRAALEEGGWAEARCVLEAELSRFRRRRGRGTSVVLVYDAGDAPAGGGCRERGFRISIPARGRVADDVVLAEARRWEGRAQVTVVTGDARDIGFRVRGLRVSWLAPDEFGDLLWQGSRGQNPAEKPEAPRGAEVARWLRLFGEDPSGGDGDPS